MLVTEIYNKSHKLVCVSNGVRSILFIDDDNGDWGVTSIVVDTVRNVNTIPGKGRLHETGRPNLVTNSPIRTAP